ncbi:DNA primase [Sphingobium algorifonticola]|uniref:DNA primase n=1 Tax=Sphingobium algorifonticola TaxID=2008318 RepID=A0A437JB48_9SPHN|nr:DNA primase [Sphingobium algorifonticola]RVT43139.1 DNA primase [Sphingobium algorifonticola]
MSLTPQWLDELRARTTLSTLIGKSIKVQKAGREYKACCPFHNEKTPSFTINDEKGFYHCFGCGAHGDAIRWMTEQRGLPFMDAVKELAAVAGMDIPAADPRAAKRAEQAKGLHDVMAAAQGFFEEQLGGIDGADARAYLLKRGISDATRRAFGFGYSPDSRTRLKTALRDFGDPMLIEAGLLIDPDASEPEGEKTRKRDSYDRFRGRLMIPIRDPRGRVIAFGGRILGAGEPKYLNSPDTPLFDKGRTLYNIDRASPAARQTGRVIVVEGYMDVVALAQAGFGECVAPLGTALTEHQIERLWKMVEVPILCFDGDAAGQKAAIRAAMRALPLLRPGHSLAFATLPQGQDPDDLVRTAGASAFEAVLTQAEPLVDRLWNHAVAAGPLETPEQRAALKQRLSEYTDAMTHNDVRAHYVQAFRERHDALFFTRSARQALPRRDSRDAGGRRGQWSKGQWKPPIAPPSGEARVIRAVGTEGVLLAGMICGLLRYPDRIRAHLEVLSALRIADRQLAAIMEKLLAGVWREESVETEGLLTILGTGELYNRAKGLLRADALTFTFTRKDADATRARRDLDEAIRVIAAGPEIEAALAEATRRAMETLDEASLQQQQDLLKLQADHQQRLADLMQPEDII